MKKKLLAALIMVLCLAYTGSTFALAPDSHRVTRDAIESTLSVDCGLTNNGGGSYTAWGSASSSMGFCSISA